MFDVSMRRMLPSECFSKHEVYMATAEKVFQLSKKEAIEAITKGMNDMMGQRRSGHSYTDSQSRYF